MKATAIMIFTSLLVTLLGGCSFLDGPTGPFPGGQLRAGDLVSEHDVEWPVGEIGMIELQLVEPLGSRTTGAFVHEGQLYVACDLGFVWRRIPAPTRWMLSLIYRVKGWHEDALRDDRVVLRIAGKRYERRAVRVTDPGSVAALRSRMESMVEEMLGSPLGELPTEGPNDIWFFRMDPRLPI